MGVRILELPSLHLGDVNPQLEFPKPKNPTKTVNGLMGSSDVLRCLVVEMPVDGMAAVYRDFWSCCSDARSRLGAGLGVSDLKFMV